MLHRRPRNHRTNLSSNELIHPGIGALIAEAMSEFSAEAVRHYPNFADRVPRIAHRLGVPSGELVLTPGSDAVLRQACHLLARRRNGRFTIFLQHPNYYCWEQMAAPTGPRLQPIPWSPEGEGGSALISAARKARGALIAVSVPNGPVGGSLEENQLDTLIKVASRNKHLIVLDACYQAFAGDWRKWIARRGDHVLVVQSFSKSHGLAGARVAAAFGSPSLIEELADTRIEHAVSMPAMILLEALLERTGVFEEIWSDIRRCRQATEARLREAGLDVPSSDANFVHVRLGTAARAEEVVRVFDAQGVRIKSLGDYSGHVGSIRYTIGDLAGTSPYTDLLLREVTRAACRPSNGRPSRRQAMS